MGFDIGRGPRGCGRGNLGDRNRSGRSTRDDEGIRPTFWWMAGERKPVVDGRWWIWKIDAETTHAVTLCAILCATIDEGTWSAVR